MLCGIPLGTPCSIRRRTRLGNSPSGPRAKVVYLRSCDQADVAFCASFAYATKRLPQLFPRHGRLFPNFAASPEQGDEELKADGRPFGSRSMLAQRCAASCLDNKGEMKSASS